MTVNNTHEMCCRERTVELQHLVMISEKETYLLRTKVEKQEIYDTSVSLIIDVERWDQDFVEGSHSRLVNCLHLGRRQRKEVK